MIDKIKLTLAVLILGVGIAAFYYFADRPDLVRVGALLGAFIVAFAVAMTSAQGKAAWQFAKSADTERRKVVWPTNKETMQVTMVVMGLVVVIALFLWFVDWLLAMGVQALTG